MRQFPIRNVELSLAAWQLAVKAVADDIDAGEEESAASTWEELIGCGVANEVDELDPMWRHALTSHVRGPAGFRVRSVYDGIQVQTDITISADGTLTSLRRRNLEPSAQAQVVEVDPVVEFVVTSGHPWPLVQRGLPPLPDLRADPRQTPLTNQVEFDLRLQPGSSVETPGTALIETAAMLDKQVQGRVSIIVFNEISGQMQLASQLWYQLPDGLVRVGETSRILRVEPGDLGYHVLYQTLGIQDSFGRAGVR
ncbi:MAG: hypothetical protein GX454_04110 [Brooklawnia sp.]|nr:hypothetical protein [Brooklawnia sp.]